MIPGTKAEHIRLGGAIGVVVLLILIPLSFSFLLFALFLVFLVFLLLIVIRVRVELKEVISKVHLLPEM